MSTRAFILAVTGCSLIVAACGSCGSYGTSAVDVGKPRLPVASVSITAPVSLLAGQSARAVATPKDANGTPLTDRPVQWFTSSAAVASISDSGVISGVAPGNAVVSAVSEGVSGEANMSVMPPAPVSVASVSVSPGSVVLQVGATAQLSAVTLDSANNVLTGRVIGWSSSNNGIATVSSSGLVTAVAAGSSTITASSGGRTGSAAITVSAQAPVPVASVSVSPASANLQIGLTTQLAATARDANNNVLSGRVVTWSSSNTAISTVSTSGLVTAIGAGSATITATSETKTGTSAITVSAPPPVPVASVTVSPATPSVNVGGTVQFSAVTRDANNNILTGRSITWSSNNLAVATVSPSALGTALAVGTAQITATSEGKVGSATLTVTSPPPPPPPGSSNEPAGMTTLTDRPFNAMNELGWSDYWPGGLMSFVSDATAPHSPTGILRATYPAGFAAGSGPGAWDPPPLGNRKTVYVAVWLRHSANWYGQESGVNKVFYMHTSTNDAPVFYFSATGVGTGDLTPQIRLQATVSPPESNLSPNLVSGATMVRGQWNLIEVVAVGNSAGNRDGSVDWYLNGVHIGSYTGIEWEAGGTTWQRFSFAPVWGGIGGTVPATQYLDFDHAYLSVK